MKDLEELWIATGREGLVCILFKPPPSPCVCVCVTVIPTPFLFAQTENSPLQDRRGTPQAPHRLVHHMQRQESDEDGEAAGGGGQGDHDAR